jgi:hypothetical protein
MMDEWPKRRPLNDEKLSRGYEEDKQDSQAKDTPVQIIKTHKKHSELENSNNTFDYRR